MIFLDERVVVFLHDHALAQHGGLPGIRDENLLRSALDRPRHLAHYRPGSDIFAFAAAYAFGISRNHSFNDGNKRTAWAVCVTFLRLHEIEIDARVSNETRVLAMLSLAEGTLSEEKFAEWLRTACQQKISDA
ncbi:MAG: type II toxin-antitoxin system death-on-curing family toxin [Hyphomicrobiales bacterium]|nr:type II toxin-antitoxin system death-on-curing family toxin [Hyphomicrobiales bacterium]